VIYPTLCIRTRRSYCGSARFGGGDFVSLLLCIWMSAAFRKFLRYLENNPVRAGLARRAWQRVFERPETVAADLQPAGRLLGGGRRRAGWVGGRLKPFFFVCCPVAV